MNALANSVLNGLAEGEGGATVPVPMSASATPDQGGEDTSPAIPLAVTDSSSLPVSPADSEEETVLDSELALADEYGRVAFELATSSVSATRGESALEADELETAFDEIAADLSGLEDSTAHDLLFAELGE